MEAKNRHTREKYQLPHKRTSIYLGHLMGAFRWIPMVMLLRAFVRQIITYSSPLIHALSQGLNEPLISTLVMSLRVLHFNVQPATF